MTGASETARIALNIAQASYDRASVRTIAAMQIAAVIAGTGASNIITDDEACDIAISSVKVAHAVCAELARTCE